MKVCKAVNSAVISLVLISFSVIHLWCHISWVLHSETFTIREHYQQIDICFEIIRHRIAQYDAIYHRFLRVRLIKQEKQKKVAMIRQEKQKRQKRQKKIELIEQKVAKQTEIEIIEIAKSTSSFSDIDIFDSTFICDILMFDLYSTMINFLQHLQQIQHQYRKSNVLDLLFKCVRDFAFA